MKKGLLIFLGVVIFLFAALAILPFFFKDEIRAKVDEEIAKSVDAKIKFDDVSLSIFKNFPNMTISIDKLSMVGTKEGFTGDTLFSAESFSAAVDLMSVISGDKVKVNGIYLNKPYILTKFTKDGKMSWDITKPSADTAEAAPSEPSNFTVAIDEWKIEDGTIIYDDASLPMYTELRHVTHKGSGEMKGDLFTMDTKTTTPEFYMSYDNVTYLNKHKLEGDAKLSMDLAKSEYRFMENKFRINDFLMHFEGLIAMPADGSMVFDLKFLADETEFKNLLSLVPAMYTKDFENIKTDGKIAFDGWYKGTMIDEQMPGYGVNLVVKDAMFQYPNLTPVTNIGVDMHVVCEDGVVDHTIIDLKKFNMDMGTNPVRAQALVKGLGPADIDANVKAKLNLADVNKMYPIEGTTLAGIFSLDATAKGVYDDANKQMPQVNAKMNMRDGYVKSADVPFPLEKVNFNAVANSNGDLATSNFLLEGFKLILDGEPFEMKAYIENFDNISYDVNLKGLIDLTKLTKVYPMEGMTLEGRINADISTKGSMADVEAGKYDKTSTSGSMSVKDFRYVSTDMPQGMTLSSANFTLTPEKMSIVNMDGFVGKSDISVKGYFSNYMGYMFGGKDSKDTVIHGTMTLASKKFDTNEWMSDEEATADSAASEEPMSVFEVPKDIDFLFASKLNTVLYDSMTLTNMIGNISMKNGILRMDRLAFDAMGGSFVMNGGYNTQNIKEPKFDFDMTISDVELAQAYKSVDMIKTYAPIAGNMEGKFSMKLDRIYGTLGQDMMPVYKTVNGAGNALVASAKIKDNKVLSGVGSLTKMKNMNPMSIQDLKIKFKIVDGKMVVEPFDVKAGDYKMNVSGQQALEGELDYLLKMDVPAGVVGAAANNAIASLTGSTPSGNQNIKMDFKVTGTHDKPKVALAGSSKEAAKDAVKDAVTDKVNAEADKLKKEAEDKARAEAEKAKAEAEAKVKAEQERIQKETEEKLKKEAEKAKKDLLKKTPFGK